MSNPAKLNFKLYQGSTFSEVLRWESSTKVYKPITAIPNAAPTVVTAVGHLVPDGWRVKIKNVGGMVEINSDNYLTATVLTADTIEFNDINSLGFKPYANGGIIEYNKPVDLTGFTARMQIRSDIDSATIIDELTTENTRIAISTVASTITLTIPATVTAQFSFDTAVYDLELISSGGAVTKFAVGTIALIKEVTK